MSTPYTDDVEACARRINEGRSTNHHAFIVLQAYSALLEASADAMRRLERAHDDADKYQLRALAAETKLARVEALVATARADGPEDGSNEHEFFHVSELEAALKGTE